MSAFFGVLVLSDTFGGLYNAPACTSGALALVASLETLATMVSVGALFVFLCVSAGVLWRRYRAPAPAPAAGLATHMAVLCALSLGAPNMHAGQKCEAPSPPWLPT